MKSITFLFFLFIISPSFSQEAKPTAEAAEIQWMTWDEAIEAQKTAPRKIFIDVYTDWCGYCKKMDNITFKNGDVIKALNDKFYAVKFDAERKDTIDFNGSKYIFENTGKRSAHQLAKALLDERMAYPSFVYLNEELLKIMPSPGFKKPRRLLKELSYIETEAYTKMSFDDFIKKAD